MKFAYLGIPHTGGTYTVYNSLRKGLGSCGIKIVWLGIGPKAQAALDNPQWSEEREHGVVVAGLINDDRMQAQALIQYLEASDFDGLFVNVLAGRVETNAIRYLSPSIKRVMIVHNITPGTYAAARAVRDHVHATIGVSPRIRDDLIKNHGFKESMTHAIPNAVDLNSFDVKRVERKLDVPLRVLFLGRVVDTDKGVFWLPKIMAKLSPKDAHLTVVGDGPDMEKLKLLCANMSSQITFEGRITGQEVPDMLARHDVFIFPSRFEGLGMSLVEAMAQGCVPVASKIKGVTDFVITDGKDGLLFDIGDVAEAANKIRSIAKDNEILKKMSVLARQNIVERFDLKLMSHSYEKIIYKVINQEINIAPTLRLREWKYAEGLKSGFRSYLPKWMKNKLMIIREKIVK